MMAMRDPVEKVTNDDFRAVYERLRQLRKRLTRAVAESRRVRGHIIRSAHQHDFVPLQLVLQRFGSR